MQDHDHGAPNPDHTVLALTEAEQRFVLLAGIGAGAFVGLAGHWIWGLIGDLGFIPLRWLGEAIFASGSLTATALRIAGGALVGLCAGAAINIFNPVVTITDSKIAIRSPTGAREIDRSQVARIFAEKGDVVIQSADGGDLYRGEMEGTRDQQRAAFLQHGYPWAN